MPAVLEQIYIAFQIAIGWIFSPSWLPPRDFDFLKWLVVPGFGYGFVLLLFALAELVIPDQKRPWGRASVLSGTYLLMAGKLGYYTLFLAPAMRKGWLYLGLPSLHLDQRLPLPVYLPVALLVVTFTGYWAHRFMHRIPVLWHIHKIHHSAVNLNYSSVFHMHFLELLLQTPFHLIAVLSLGTDIVAPFGVVFMFIDVFGHANVRVNTGWLTYLISTPQAHRVHHSIEARHYDRNFSNTFMWWDHVFRTFHYDPQEPPRVFGVRDPVPPSFFQQQIMPFVWIVRDVRSALAARFMSRPQLPEPAVDADVPVPR